MQRLLQEVVYLPDQRRDLVKHEFNKLSSFVVCWELGLLVDQVDDLLKIMRATFVERQSMKRSQEDGPRGSNTDSATREGTHYSVGSHTDERKGARAEAAQSEGGVEWVDLFGDPMRVAVPELDELAQECDRPEAPLDTRVFSLGVFAVCRVLAGLIGSIWEAADALKQRDYLRVRIDKDDLAGR